MKRYCSCTKLHDWNCTNDSANPPYPWTKPKKNGTAVIQAFRTLQLQELARYAKAGYYTAMTCASGTAHNTGAAIVKSIRSQHLASLARAS